MSSENYILFLKLTDDIPECFYHLSNNLSNLDVSLIPIEARDLGRLASSQMQHLMVFIPDLQSFNRFQKLRKQFLDFALIGKKFCLFEMSSFAPIDIASRLKRLNMYHHFKLPILLEQVLRPVALAFYQQSCDTQKWPGGRRATLPVIN